MNKSVVLIGAGGHGKVVADIVRKCGDEVIGFLDDNPLLEEKFLDFPVLGPVENYNKYAQCSFVITIGNAIVRKNIAERMTDIRWYTAIHPSAQIAGIGVQIGEGTVVMANTVINAGTKIGKHCIINSGAIVEHDNQIGDYVHVSVGAKLAGTVSIGNGTWIGIGAIINNNISVCGECMIGAGGVVVKNIKQAGTYVGVPAERMIMEHMSRKNREGGNLPGK